MSFDLPSAEPLPATKFGPGAALVVPIRWRPRPGTGLRLSAEFMGAQGSDTVVWTETTDDASVDYFSDSHTAAVVAARFLAGPELVFLPSARFSPYLGVSGGAAVVTTFHSFDEHTAVLSSAGTGGLDPYTLQFVPGAAANLGVRIGRPGRLALELEAGYTLSFLPAAPLRAAPEALAASRSAYALDVVRVGLGLTAPL